MIAADPDSTPAAPQTTTGIPESVLGPGLHTVVEGLRHPEGVCWMPEQQLLYAGGEGGELYRFDLDARSVETVATVSGGSMLGLAADGDGALYVCDVGNGCVQQITADGEVRRYGDPIGYPNYPAFDSEGRLWVSDSGAWGQPTGGIVRIDRDGRTHRILESLHFANGIAVHGEWLYIVESTWPRIVRIPLAGGDLEPVVVLDRAVPDGIAFDAEGGLWIGCWQPNRVYRLDPAGELHIVIDDWSGVYAPTPTNLAFAGPGLDVLVLASLGTSTVNACDPGFAGAPLHRPTGLTRTRLTRTTPDRIPKGPTHE